MLAVTPLRQATTSSCGPAALRMVLDFFGMKKTEAMLTKLCKTTVLGTHAKSMVRTVKKLGFEAFVKDFSTPADLRRWVMEKRIPVIVPWFSTTEGHYSVVVDINKKRLVLADPETGKRRTLPITTFLGVWFDFRGAYMKSPDDLVLRRMIVVYPKRG